MNQTINYCSWSLSITQLSGVRKRLNFPCSACRDKTKFVILVESEYTHCDFRPSTFKYICPEDGRTDSWLNPCYSSVTYFLCCFLHVLNIQFIKRFNVIWCKSNGNKQQIFLTILWQTLNCFFCSWTKPGKRTNLIELIFFM